MIKACNLQYVQSGNNQLSNQCFSANNKQQAKEKFDLFAIKHTISFYLSYAKMPS